MNDKELESLFGITPTSTATTPQVTPTAVAEEQTPDEAEPTSTMDTIRSGLDAAVKSLGVVMGADPNAQMPEADIEQTPEARLADMDPAGRAVAGALGGGMQAVFETKDFLFGDTPREEQSPARAGLTELNDAAKGSGIIGGLSSGIGQFTVAMMGLGKLGVAARALPWVGRGASAVEGLKGGSAVLESGKAALAGAIAFDPHEERLSNLIQDTPLANPFNAWLAADPEDTAAMGRLKSAMESLGMDAAIIGTFAGGLRVWKYLREGKTAEASRAVGQLEAEQRALMQGDAVEDAAAKSDLMRTSPEVEQKAGARLTPVADFTAEELAGIPARPGSMDIPKPGLLDDVDIMLENAEKDWDNLERYGDSWKARQAGHDLSPDMGTFYDRFRTDSEVLQYVDLLVHHKAEKLGEQGFRVKLSDEKLQRQVQSFALMADINAAELGGLLQQAGEESRTLTAKMLVAGSLAAKAYTDAHSLATLRKLGDYSKFGSLEAMEAEIAKRFAIATTLLKVTDDIRAQAGRTLRANRGKPFDLSLFEGLSKDRFYDLLAESGGSPAKLKMLADPSLGRKLMDTVNYMRISSLISGPKTQLINIMTNGYMLGVRPLERILGSVPGAVTGNTGSRQLIRQNLKQYAYMGSAFVDGFGQAVKAFTRNDGLLRPHSSEAYGELANVWKVPGTQGLGKGYFKPLDRFGHVLYNALSVPLTVAGVGPRTLGGVDELVKQITYRSKVMAAAHIEGVEQANASGLRGKAAKDYVRSYVSTRLDAAFDADGRGLDPEALQEASIATFQQDLLPGTLGKQVQHGLANEHSQMLRLILPFVKTPTNVIRYGWKMTPGLNMLQTEYRQMIIGKLGQEARAQAIGQMSMGTLFLGAGAYLTSQGMVTGGGPSDPKLKAQLMATGWRPYSIVTENDDGTKTYIPFERYDPVALPFGIMADIQDALSILGDDADSNPDVENAVGALLMSLSKQFTSRTYLLSLNQALEALSDPERRGGRFTGGLAQSFVPFSAFTRQTSGDPYLRDARTIADKMMQVIPGMSTDLPPRYNWAGQPILNRQGLWTDDNGSLVDGEMQRLALEGYGVGNPSWEMGSKGGKVDLRDITLTTGENAYIKLQQLAGQPTPKARTLRDAVAKVMRSNAYQRAPDGESGTRGTKMWILMGVIGKYRDVASKRIRADKNVREALMATQRKVNDHYKHLKQTPTPEQTDNIRQVIGAFVADN